VKGLRNAALLVAIAGALAVQAGALDFFSGLPVKGEQQFVDLHRLDQVRVEAGGQGARPV
jgi:hypothetical protein